MPNDLQSTLTERQGNYGDFTENATVAQTLKNVLRGAPQWHRMSAPHREALDVICDKISRIVAGNNPNYKDNWHDIQGYARLAEERCKE